ncbi:MAG: 30S ribosomal protein S3ae [Candidatus Bathyarchaeia archaeon]
MKPLSSRKTRRVRDKWRAKKWYTVFAPSYFGEVELGSIPVSEGFTPVGRAIETTLYDVTKDFSHQNIGISFQVTDVQGSKASTIFKGHEYARDYLRSIVRRGSTRVDDIFDVTTKDGYRLRLSILACTPRRINSTQSTSLRHMMEKVSYAKAQELLYDQFVQEVVLGKLASDIYNEGKKVVPLRHVGVRKSRLIARPQPPAAGADVLTNLPAESASAEAVEELEEPEASGEAEE